MTRSLWSFEVGTLGGVSIRVHITLVVLLGYCALGYSSSDDTVTAQGSGQLLAAALLMALAAHELAHGIVARILKVQPHSLMLLPFGGITTLLVAPTPWRILAVYASGPACSLLLALAFGGLKSSWETLTMLLSNTSLSNPSLTDSAHQVSFLQSFAALSLLLGAINCIPATPLDGGRIVKALLQLTGIARPQRVLSRISQLCCLATAIFAFFLTEPLLFATAFVIFLGALQEHVRSEGLAAATACTVRDAMIPAARLEKFSHGTTVSAALRVALTSLQPLFPVMLNAKLLGFVLRDTILEHSAFNPDAYINTIALQSLEAIQVEAPLVEALSRFDETGAPLLIVKKDDEFVGLLVPDRVAEFVLMRSLPSRFSDSDDVPWSVPM